MSVAVLKKVPLFKGLKSDEIENILKMTSSKRYYKNNTILSEADKLGSTFYIISKGKVKVSRIGEDKKEIVLSFLGSGDFFGEMSLIDGLSRSATITSVNDTEVLTMRGKDFQEMLKKYPKVTMNLTKVLVARLRQSDAQIKRLSLMNTIGRIASTILSLVPPAKRGHRAVIDPLPPSKDIANMAGVSGSSVTRAIKNLEKSGYVKKEGKKVIITNFSEFEKMYC